ncbi:MAG: hypothetical protein ABI651_20530 [Verrucomicrobiota bacterium]
MFARRLKEGQVLHNLPAPPKEPANQQVIAPKYMKSDVGRTFAIEYVGKLSGVPDGAIKLRVWMPVPQDSTVQTIRELSFSQTPRLTSEPKCGNKIAYWEFDKPQSNVELTMKFVCRRQEAVVDLALLSNDGKDAAVQFVVYKEPDKLVLVDDANAQGFDVVLLENRWESAGV